MKQVLAGGALEAVLAAAQRPPSNEDSRTRPLVITRRFEAKLRYFIVIRRSDPLVTRDRRNGLSVVPAVGFVPPAVMLLVWSGAPPAAVAEILHATERRD